MLLKPHLFALSKERRKETLERGGLIGPKICLIPRSECTFRRMRLKGSGKSARQAVLMKVRKEALSQETQFRIIKDNTKDTAGIWSYAQPALNSDADINVYIGRTLPESLARQPLEHGVRLVNTLTGLEGQLWQDGDLLASRWWADQPSQTQWERFLLASETKIPIEYVEKPAVQSIPFRRDLPLVEFNLERISQTLSPFNVAVVMATLLGCVGLYLGGQYAHNNMTLKFAQSDIASISDHTAEILSQRRRALGHMTTAAKLAIFDYDTAFIIGLNDICIPFDKRGLSLIRLRLRDQSIEAVFQGEADISVPDAVTILEGMPSLKDVNISIGANQTIIVKAELISRPNLSKTLNTESPTQ